MDIGVRAQNTIMRQWTNFSDVTRSISEREPLLKGIENVTPSPDFRIAGQKIPREPHRYSGRTAMLANVNVSEPKPAEDPDSAMSYTMEGYRGIPPSSMVPFFWSPGWNSVQSVNKYQEEVGAALKGGDPGVMLVKPNGTSSYFTAIPDFYKAIDGQLWAVAVHHIFGSEELSAKGNALSQRVPRPYVLLHPQEASSRNVADGQNLSFQIEGTDYELPVTLSEHLPKGVIGFPSGLPGMAFSDLPAWAILRTKSVSNKTLSTSTT